MADAPGPPLNFRRLRPSRATTIGIGPNEQRGVAARLLSLAQLLGSKGENPFKIRAYRRAAETIRNYSENFDQLVRADADLTQFAGIGKGISSAVREIVLSGKLGQLETLRTEVAPELAALSEYPRLDPRRVCACTSNWEFRRSRS